MSPICLPPKRLWKKKFRRFFVQVAGYGRIEKEEEEGRYQKLFRVQSFTFFRPPFINGRPQDSDSVFGEKK